MKLGGINLNEGGLGGYKLCNIPATKLPQDVATAVVKVNMDLLGASYLPIRLVGTQVVNGVNYMFIAKQILATETKDTNIVMLVINIPAGDATGAQAQIVEVIDEATLPPEVQDAFDGAVGPLHGVNYDPLLYVGNQVVKGINYYIICEATTIYPGAVPKPVVVCVNAFEGKYSLVSVEQIYAYDEEFQPHLGKPLGEWP
jgi:hypothetical protein